MISNLRLRVKLLLLGLVPTLLLAVLLSGIAVYELQDLASQQEIETRESLTRDRRAELQHYVEVARNALGAMYERSADGDMAARAEAVSLLQRLSYGADGYFWGYDDQAVRVLQGSTRDKIGESFYSYQDPSGIFAIRDLVKAGQNGTHFVSYSFEMPGSKAIVPKIGYA